MSGDHESSQAGQLGAVWTKSGPLGPYEDLRSPEETLRAPRGQEEALYQVKVCDHETGQLGAVSFEDIRGSKRGISEPKRTLFACFLELGGSIWATPVLDEQGIPLRWSGHPTSQYLKQKNSHQELGLVNLAPDIKCVVLVGPPYSGNVRKKTFFWGGGGGSLSEN